MKHSYPEAYFGEMPQDHIADRQTALNNLSPYKRCLATFIDSLPHGARVLDIGCGSGRTARLVLSLRPDLHMTACDINDTRALLPAVVAFTQCSAEAIGTVYPSNHFDAIMCQHVIEHLQSPIGLMGSVQTVLKSGGRLFLETPNWTRLFIPFSHMFFWNDYTHVRPYPRFALVKVLLEHGFTIETIRTCSSSTWFQRKIKDKDVSSRSVKTQNTKKKKGTPIVNAYRFNSLISRIVARIVNPFLRDIIIVVARKNI